MKKEIKIDVPEGMELDMSEGAIYIYAPKKLAKCARAMARINQIMASDKRFGGPITDEGWGTGNFIKYCICRWGSGIETGEFFRDHHFLAFHTQEQRDLFLQENEDLIKQYLMID